MNDIFDFDVSVGRYDQGAMKDTDWNAAGYPEVNYPEFTVVDLVFGVTFLENHKIELKRLSRRNHK